MKASPETLDLRLKALAPFVSGHWCSAEAFQRAMTIASHFPADFSTHFVLENRLNASEEVDLSLSSRMDHESAATWGLSDSFLENKHWQNLSTFHDAFRDKSAPYYINVIGAEFDEAAAQQSPPIPSVFFMLRNGKKGLQYHAGQKALTSRYVEDISRASLMLNGEGFSDALEERLHAILMAFRPTMYVFLTAFLLARHVDYLRICICINKAEDLTGFLKDIGWINETGALELAPFLAEQTSKLIVHLDVGKSLSPRIGFECYFEKDGVYEMPADFRAMLTSDMGCDPAQLGLLDNMQRQYYYQFPYTTHAAQLNLKPSHIKLSFDPARPPLVKSYLSLRTKS